MPDQDVNIREQILHSIRSLTRATVALFLSIVLVTGIGFLDSVKQKNAIAEVSLNNRAALCAFRSDLERRVETTKKFLRRNDDPEPIPGVTRNSIRTTLRNQQRTLVSFRSLDCEDLPAELL